MRLVCHMVVGPGEASRYLEQVLNRALFWADDLHVSLDSRAGDEEWEIVSNYATAYERLNLTWEANEGRFRARAWHMLEKMSPSGEDFIICLDADEVIADHLLVRMAATEFPGHQIQWRFHEMWTPNQYRIDGFWKPYPAGIMFPFRENGHFLDRPLASGRQPTYVANLPASRVIGDILHYGYLRPEDRVNKYDRYMRLDGGKYHNMGHLQSIIQPPSLEAWNKGGLLDA